MPTPVRALLRWVALLALIPLGTCSVLGGDPSTEVVLLGDSIAEETAPYLRPRLGDTKMLERSFGGTAPCDWLGSDLYADRHRIVVVSFTGNSLTSCMAGGEEGHLHGQALIDKYRTDLTALVSEIQAEGARVVLVGQPPRGPAASNGTVGDLEVAGINAIYTELANAAGVSFVDAGAALEAPDGTFAAELPCRPDEDECGLAGRNAVRSGDGVHLCPVIGPAPCPVYSSGAFRFADAIANAIEVL